MSARIRSLSGRVGVAVGCVAVALLLQMPLWLVFEQAFPFATLLPAVLVAGYLGGRLPGLTATVLGTVASLFLIPWPVDLFSSVPRGAASPIGFFVGGVLISLLAGSLHSARRDLEDRAEEASRTTVQLEALLSHAPIGFALFDENRLAIRVNPQLADLCGQPVEALLGQDIEAILPPGAVSPELLEQIFSTGGSFIEREWSGELTPGNERSWLLRLYPVPADGSGGGLVGLLVLDISRRRRQEDELRLRAGELAENDRRKDIFLAMLSHELRNPLAALRGAAELLILGEPAKPELVTLLRRQMGMLTRLVDDLLDTSRVSRGQIDLRRHTVSLFDVIEAAIETARPHIDEKAHRVETKLPSRAVMVKADPTRLTQALANLLHNAARYTPAGGQITISLAVEEQEAVIRVTDTGIGIRHEMLGRIFELFQQGEQLAGQVQQGLGLGLTLVRRLVELHGGSVQAQSAGPGTGSTFEVRLPVLPMTSQPSPHPPARQTASGTVQRVLIVDDNDDAAETLSLLLQTHRHEVRVVHTGPEALEAVDAWQPHVVFLDIGLPGMNGYEVASRLRQRYGDQTPWLIALTGYGRAEERKSGEEAGFNRFLVKPASPEDLLQAMQRVAVDDKMTG